MPNIATVGASEVCRSYHKSSQADFLKLLDGEAPKAYCRYLWSPVKKEQSWQAIGYRESGKPVTTLDDFLDSCWGGMDVFISPNQFFDWRNARQLSALHASWLDIDTKNHSILSHEQASEVLQEVFCRLEAARIPPPTGYVRSGSGGLHLYWMYEGVEAYKWRIAAWKALSEKLAKSFGEGGRLWSVDPTASSDPARMMRLPNTYHVAACEVATFFLGQRVYSFNELCDLMDVRCEKPNHLKLVPSQSQKKVSHAKKSKRSGKQEKSPGKPGKHSIGNWWGRVLWHIQSHFRKIGGVPKGCRDITLFLIYVALRHLKPEQEAFDQAINIASSFFSCDKETLDELSGYLSTARKIHYKFKKPTLARWLDGIGVDSGFLFQVPIKQKLDPEAVRAKQKESAYSTASKKRARTFDRIKAALCELRKLSKPATQGRVAEIVGVSARTVRRYWKQATGVRDIRSSSIYAPSLELSA